MNEKRMKELPEKQKLRKKIKTMMKTLYHNDWKRKKEKEEINILAIEKERDEWKKRTAEGRKKDLCYILKYKGKSKKEWKKMKKDFYYIS